jgi:hypothetical protein
MAYAQRRHEIVLMRYARFRGHAVFLVPRRRLFMMATHALPFKGFVVKEGHCMEESREIENCTGMRDGA